MKILVLTRVKELRNVESILGKIQAEVTIFTGTLNLQTWWFRLCDLGELHHFYHKTLKYQGDYWKNRMFEDTPRWKIWKFLRHFKSVKPSEEALAYIKSVDPDYVFVTNLFHPPYYEDYNYTLAAKKLGIPIVAFVARWDTLTTKAKVQVMPDIVYCWNDDHEYELINYHGIPKEKIKKVGSWTFEMWLRRTEKKGEKKTYLCSSPNIAPVENPVGYDYVLRYPKNAEDGVSFEEKYRLYEESAEIYTINSSAALEALLIGKRVSFVPYDWDKTWGCLHYQGLMVNLSRVRDWMGFTRVLPTDLIARDFNLSSFSPRPSSWRELCAGQESS